MISREELMAKIECVPDERLEEVNRLPERFTESKQEGKDNKSFMQRLREIKIQAPPDFATNINDYLSGEKKLD